MPKPPNVLFVCPRMASPETHGLTLRVANVARQLALRNMHCHAVVDEHDREAAAAIFDRDVFGTIHGIPAITPTNWARVFRLSNENYLGRADPGGFRRIVSELRAVAATTRANVAIAASSDAAEYARAVPAKLRIADICDSPSLTLEREHAAIAARSAAEAGLRRLERLRAKRLERAICRSFDRIVAISEADREAVADSALPHDRCKVLTISNGVADRYLAAAFMDRRDARAIAFWGNLDFAPNAAAVSFFCEEVFVPFLAGDAISFRILGRNAPEEIRALAALCPAIQFEGFAPDLTQALANVPIMINPMIMGAGQKNKVLEAFALGLAVVSTRLGMSGIDAVDGEHYLEANDPASFAAAIRLLLEYPERRRALCTNARRLVIEKYSWDSIGGHWHEMILRLAKDGARAA
jgi:glycosyltransferase involved in cell wall biosynthesis